VPTKPLGAAMQQIADWLEKLDLGQYAERLLRMRLTFLYSARLARMEFSGTTGRQCYRMLPMLPTANQWFCLAFSGFDKI
jgi:hypothetical protein